MRIAILLAALLVGCTQQKPVHVDATKPREYQRTHQVGSNQIVAVVVPGEEWFQSQRCYIYRDLEFKTSSISCPSGEHGQAEPD